MILTKIPKKKPKASEPEWLLMLISHVKKMDKLFPTIKISDANMAIEIARVQNYFSVVKNYPLEILVLVQKLRKRISSGKSIKSFLEKEFFQTKTPEKHFLLLDSFVKTKVFPIEEKYISEITKLLKEKTIDQNALQKIRQCFERIHEQFEENHRLIGHALAEWEAKE